MAGAAGESLDDELVGGNVDVVGGNANRGGVGGEGLGLSNVDAVKSLLGVLELGEAVGHSDGGGTGIGDLSSQGCVGDGDVDRGAISGDPGAGKGVGSRGLELLNEISGGDLAGNTGSSLLGVQTQVTLHGLQNLGVEVGRSLGGSTVGNGQDDCQEGEELGQLHVECWTVTV